MISSKPAETRYWLCKWFVKLKPLPVSEFHRRPLDPFTLFAHLPMPSCAACLRHLSL